MNSRIRLWASIFLILFLWVGSSPLQAQTIYGSISGTVYDQSGAALPGADVTVKNLETGTVRQTITNDVGFFRVPALPSGDYSVQVSMQAFETILRQPIRVAVSSDAALEFRLRPAELREVVTVVSEASLIETSKSQVSKLADAKQIMELPGRQNMTGLALLQAGTTPNNNARPGSGFVVNGARTRSNNFTIDGANNNDQSLSIPRVNLPAEAIQEFQMVTNNFSAEYGRNSGSYVNVITRSGTNDFHGAVTWAWLGNGFDALSTGQERTFKSSLASGYTEKQALRRARGVVVQNAGGATIGGPIKKDQAFFFTNYDRGWYRTTAVPSPAVAISPQNMSVLQSFSSEFAPGALDFLKSTFPIANDPTDRGGLTILRPSGEPISMRLNQFNRSLEGSLPYGRDYWRWLQKVDINFSENDRLSARYVIYNSNDPGSPAAIPGNEIGQVLRDQNLSLNEVHVFGPRTVNEARVSYSRRSLNTGENLPPFVQITGFNYVGNYNYPQYRTDNVFEYTDNISHTMTRHNLKAGVNVLRYQLNSFFAPNSMGSVYYPSVSTLLNDQNASYYVYAGDGYVPARTTEVGAFFQDDFRVRSNLTLNLGVRYEYTGAPFGYFSNAEPDTNNWAPRIGFAWSPRGNGLLGQGRTVIRGGYAISYDQVFQNILLNTARNYPRGVSLNFANISGDRLYNPANRPVPPAPEAYVQQGGNPDMLAARYFALDGRIAQPYGQQFSLGVERQIGGNYAAKVFYIGSRGVKLVREVERNIGFNATAVNANPSAYADILPKLKPITNAAGTITSYKMDPTKGSTLVSDGLAQSVYHSLQLTLDKRFSQNHQFQVNYTWSAHISDSDDILGGQNNRTLPAYPFNIRLDRARSGFDQPHRFVTNYIYQFPQLFRDQKVLNRILGGWQVSGVGTVATGSPYTVLNSFNALGILPGQISTVEGSQRASLNPNGDRTADGRPLPTHAGATNPYYIANPANSGIIGTAGANTERLGRTVSFDASLAKNVRTFGEGHGLQLRWEVFNVLNYRIFDVIPARNVSATTDTATFLNLGRTNVGGRNMQFMLRYNF
jgi:hypothetical protein